ncbi:MAG: Sir2 family NAD-dependent protein deacetylase [Alphaproteobacteria bacterium]|nr:Sir2 family NAD-dependent protein deacetylase [Alphaproteobacteria bacterium]
MLEKLKDLVARSRRVVVFTGAGISTESGIPDFRSPGGIWSKNRVIYFDEFVRSREARVEAWTRLFDGRPTLKKAEPNAGHRAVARLVELGKVSEVITQNIDGLHQRAGVPAERVIEVHGNATYAKCLSCGQRHEFDDIEPAFKATGEPPSCVACGGVVKSATISFGQAMPEDEMERAAEAVLACDLCLAIGSSLVVYPAAGLPIAAKRNGAKFVILNRDPTELDHMADLVINAEIGPTLAKVVGVN